MATDIFTHDEYNFLRRYGTWMEALEKGNILPETSEQIAFLNVCQSVIEPKTKFERAWIKLRERRKFEEEWVCHDPENNRKAMDNTFGHFENWQSNTDR